MKETGHVKIVGIVLLIIFIINAQDEETSILLKPSDYTKYLTELEVVEDCWYEEWGNQGIKKSCTAITVDRTQKGNCSGTIKVAKKQNNYVRSMMDDIKYLEEKCQWWIGYSEFSRSI